MTRELTDYDDRAYSLPVQRNPLEPLHIDRDIDLDMDSVCFPYVWVRGEPLASPPVTELDKMRAELLVLAKAYAELAEARRAERAPPAPTPRPFPARALRHRVQAVGLISTLVR